VWWLVSVVVFVAVAISEVVVVLMVGRIGGGLVGSSGVRLCVGWGGMVLGARFGRAVGYVFGVGGRCVEWGMVGMLVVGLVGGCVVSIGVGGGEGVGCVGMGCVEGGDSLVFGGGEWILFWVV